MAKAVVILFKPGGKYYTEEAWEIPHGTIGPYDMDKSPDFRRIDGAPVLIDSDVWGYPHLFPGTTLETWGDVTLTLRSHP